MADDIIIGVHLTPAQYRVYLDIATTRQTQVHCLIESLAVRAIMRKPKPSGRKVVDREQLRALHSEGFNDREIGERMGFTASAIQSHRDDMGLPKHNSNVGRPKKAGAAA